MGLLAITGHIAKKLIPCCIRSASKLPSCSASSNSASSSAVRGFFRGRSSAIRFWTSLSGALRSGSTLFGKGAAPDVALLCEDGMIRLIEIMKSLGATWIVSGLICSFSLDLYICGYFRCTAFKVASVHNARRSAPPYPLVI